MSEEAPKVTVNNEGPVILCCDGLEGLPKAVQDGLLDMIRDAVRDAGKYEGTVSDGLDWETLENIASDCSRAAGRLYKETYDDKCNPNGSYHQEALLFLLLFYSRRRMLKAKGE